MGGRDVEKAMRGMGLAIAVILLGWMVSPADPALAGECLDSPREYLERLERRIPAEGEDGRGTILFNLYCLRSKVDYLAMGYEYFASPTAIDKIHGENRETRPAAYRILPPLLRSKDPEIRCSAARTLAFYGWPESYPSLRACEDGDLAKTDAILHAILGDKRAIPWIIERYRAVEKKYRTKPMFSYPEKMTYLNALYHLADPESLPFIEGVIEHPKPEKIRERAIKVKERIEQPAAG